MPTTLETIREAIREHRAYLETSDGRRLVVAYNHENGWATTNNSDGYLDQRSFMVCLSDIKIAEVPCYTEERVHSNSSFEFKGKTVLVHTNEVVRTWHWW